MKKYLVIIVLTFLVGCNSKLFDLPPQPVPAYHWVNPQKNLYSTGRVVFLELYNDTDAQNITIEITKNLARRIQKKQIFGITVVKRDSSKWKSLQIKEGETLDLPKIAAINDILNCDALIIGKITEYSSFPHLAIGLDMKMIDLHDGENIWMLEQVWESDDRNTEYRIKQYVEEKEREDSVSFKDKIVAMSRYEFMKFISYEVANTFE